MIAPLDGVLVLDLTQTLAGPFGSMILADLGANVIKIEPPGQRQIVGGGTFFKGESVHFLSINRNKKSIILDLKNPKGKQVFYDLTKKADVVMDNYRAGVPERLGVDYETLKKINPKIICCSVTGFGSSGPYRERPCYDLIVQAMSGGMSMTGDPPPARAGLPIGDLCGGMFAAQGITAALYQRQTTGIGQRVEVALFDCQIAMLTYCVPDYFVSGKMVGPVGIGQRGDATYRMYRTKDRPIVIAIAPGAKFWDNLCRALERPELATDPRFETLEKRRENSPELINIIQDIFLTRISEEWLVRLVKEDVPAGPVNDICEALGDPQVEHQQMVVPVDFLGEKVKMAGRPIKMSAGEPVYNSPPLFGQHTEEVLSQVLGYPQERIAQLKHENVI